MNLFFSVRHSASTRSESEPVLHSLLMEKVRGGSKKDKRRRIGGGERESETDGQTDSHILAYDENQPPSPYHLSDLRANFIREGKLENSLDEFRFFDATQHAQDSHALFVKIGRAEQRQHLKDNGRRR